MSRLGDGDEFGAEDVDVLFLLLGKVFTGAAGVDDLQEVGVRVGSALRHGSQVAEVQASDEVEARQAPTGLLHQLSSKRVFRGLVWL